MNDPQTPPPDAHLPSAEEVVGRLERFWANTQAAVDPFSTNRQFKFGRYVVERICGQGAFGVVYLARDAQLNRPVALKVPRPQVLADREKRSRFEAEASAAAMLGHPGIITVFEADLSGPTPFIAAEFCPGPDLGQWLLARDGAVVAWDKAAIFVATLADAVQYAHDNGVYHRDLKPSNVLLMPVGNGGNGIGDLDDYSSKLTDFGLAKLSQAGAVETRSSLLLGTPLYMAPEQLEGNHSAPPAAADVYSLGCLLYELVSGRTPIEGETYAAVVDRLRDRTPAPLRQVTPGVPKDLETIGAKCLEKNPLARYQSAADLAADLRACVKHAPIHARPPSWWARLSYWATRRERIRDAGWYTLCIQTLFAFWLSTAVAGAYYTTFVDPQFMPRILTELAIVVGTVHVPMAVVGWFTTRRRAWAIPTGLTLSILNLVLPLLFIVTPLKPFFTDIYDNVDESAYFSFSIGSLMLLAELGQVALYAAALAAWRRMRD